MRKIVSKDGISFFYEKKDDDIECIAYENNIHMTGQSIGEHLGISKCAISQSLKKSIKRIYYSIKRKHKKITSIEIICTMASMFNIKSDSEYKKFFKMFPKNIKGYVYAEYKKGQN